MNKDFASFATRLRALISNASPSRDERVFNDLALELFSLQFTHNAAYRMICEGRKLTPPVIEHWTQIPSIPTGTFKELELTSIVPEERTAVFHSSGTTEQKPSRHFHSGESLELYKASLCAGFDRNVPGDSILKSSNLICLTPPPELVPHSSLVHMFDVVRQKLGISKSIFVGKLDADGSWVLDFEAFLKILNPATPNPNPRGCLLLGTAFSFVHLLNEMAEKNMRLELPKNSRIMETGGYKNRSRSLPKAELHALIAKFLGIPNRDIICEYGMSELSSQAYDAHLPGVFQFPPWARVQIISPETGREVTDGEMGLIRIFDLANVFSVSAIQTEDLGIRRGDGFELVGRAKLSEARGCSLMAA